MRLSRLSWLILALPMLLAASPAEPPAPPKTVEPLIVSPLKPPTPEEMRSLAERFAQALSQPSPKLGQLSRWMTPVCPRALGLRAAYDRFVEARIAGAAKAAGSPRGSGPCRAANVFVIFTSEPQRLIDMVKQKRNWLLGFHYAAQTQRLTDFKGPIQAWYVTVTGSDTDSEVDDEFSQMPGGSPGSRFTARLKSRFEDVLVIVDLGQIADQPIGRIADAAAMAALARSPQSDGCHDLPTILDALKPDCPASADLQEMSEADRAYLKGLYGSDPELFLPLQRGAIASRMTKELGGRQ